MTAETAQQIDRRYSELAGHLRACWAFEQFFHRLRRNLPDREVEPSPGDFREVLDQFKELGRDLPSGVPAEIAARLDRFELRLRDRAAQLSVQDSRVSASDLRRFLGRVRRLDEDLLLELLRFHVFAAGVRHWDSDLVDKVDFLLSRLGEEIAGPLLSHDRIRLTSSLASLWATAPIEPPNKALLGALRAQIADVEWALDSIEDLAMLEDEDIVGRYRKLKHGLGPLLVEPTIAEAVLRANGRLSRVVQRLHGEEEWHLAANFALMTKLQEDAALSETLSIEVESLRLEMERLEEGRRHDDVRNATVRRVRRQVDSILPRMQSPAEQQTSEQVLEEPVVEPAEPAKPLSMEEVGELFLQRLFAQLEALLVATDSVDEAETVLQDPGLPFGLERREIEAFLLLRGQAGHSSEDRLLLTAAALRLRLKVLRDHLEAGEGDEAEREAQSALELGETLLTEFSGRIATAERAAATQDAADLRFLRVMLMKDFSTLWLEVKGAN